MPRTVATKTTYLEMLEPPHYAAQPEPPPRNQLQIQRLHSPALADYRFLYNSVGRDFQWVDRNLLEDQLLLKILQHPEVDVLRLLDAEVPAGFAELDRRTAGQIELAYFGLFPSHIGRGLGGWFLRQVVRQAWRHTPQRVWVHTCDLDHPAALPNYVRAGFRVYDEQVLQQILPDE